MPLAGIVAGQYTDDKRKLLPKSMKRYYRHRWNDITDIRYGDVTISVRLGKEKHTWRFGDYHRAGVKVCWQKER